MEKVVNGSGDYISKESNYIYFPSMKANLTSLDPVEVME